MYQVTQLAELQVKPCRSLLQELTDQNLQQLLELSQCLLTSVAIIRKIKGKTDVSTVRATDISFGATKTTAVLYVMYIANIQI